MLLLLMWSVLLDFVVVVASHFVVKVKSRVERLMVMVMMRDREGSCQVESKMMKTMLLIHQ